MLQTDITPNKASLELTDEEILKIVRGNIKIMDQISQEAGKPHHDTEHVNIPAKSFTDHILAENDKYRVLDEWANGGWNGYDGGFQEKKTLVQDKDTGELFCMTQTDDRDSTHTYKDAKVEPITLDKWGKSREVESLDVIAQEINISKYAKETPWLENQDHDMTKAAYLNHEKNLGYDKELKEIAKTISESYEHSDQQYKAAQKSLEIISHAINQEVDIHPYFNRGLSAYAMYEVANGLAKGRDMNWLVENPDMNTNVIFAANNFFR